ncbi:CHAT domain-containing protein [Streptomyces sp. NPDC005141]
MHLREDLAALQERAPDLAVTLEQARAVLNSASTSRGSGLDTAGDIAQVYGAESDLLNERRRAARDWDATVDQIRLTEGFRHFLRPVPFNDLRAAAPDGAVVVVNISRHGSHALIVTAAAVQHPNAGVVVVDLPAASMATVVQHANTVLRAQFRAADPSTDWQTKEADRHGVFDVLEWAWQAIAEPVLTVLGHTQTPEGRIEDRPRVWWCLTGPASVLPLHAAGRHPRTMPQYSAMGEAAAITHSVVGRVVSSYTSTLTTLIRTRARPAPDRVRQLAVGVSAAPSYAASAGALPAVPVELQAVAGHLSTPEFATHLLDLTATRQSVLEALPDHTWLHLSCHGIQHPTDASRSAFLLYDQPLILADLATLDLREADLAFLAACQTATGDLRLLDEALHLAAVLQLIGYRQVLATLWSISDAAAPAMADIVYAHLSHPDPDEPGCTDRPEAARAPYALHHAVTRLRQICPGEPLLWAPYIHLGI